MLSASWERAAKPGTPPTTGDPHPPAGRHLSSSSELGVCWPSKATTFYSVCTEPKQTTMYRLLFSFSFEMRHLVFSPAIWPVHPSLSDTGSSKLAEGPLSCRHRCSSSACSAPTCEKKREEVQELVSTMATRGAVRAHSPRGPAVHVAFLTL